MSKRSFDRKFNKSTSTTKPAHRIKDDKKKDDNILWVIKVTLLTFFTTGVFTFLSDTTVSGSSLLVASCIVLFLILISIVFDIVGVAVTSCNVATLTAVSKRGVKGAKLALTLVRNANKVSSICSDVIGDICGIVCGSCGAVIVLKLLAHTSSDLEFALTILVSSLVAGLTVGGKAFGKRFAITYSKELVMLTARILSVFYKTKER